MESQLVICNIEDVQDWCILICKKQESEELNGNSLPEEEYRRNMDN